MRRGRLAGLRRLCQAAERRVIGHPGEDPVDTFCLVHGAWHDDACWELLVTELERRGHECVTPVLPLEDGGASYEDYAAVVVECLKGRDAPVLVGHSMSSAVIPLVAVRRAVRLLVY